MNAAGQSEVCSPCSSSKNPENTNAPSHSCLSGPLLGLQQARQLPLHEPCDLHSRQACSVAVREGDHKWTSDPLGARPSAGYSTCPGEREESCRGSIGSSWRQRN